MHTHEALPPDAERIHELTSCYSEDGSVVRRTLAEICENGREFVVHEEGEKVIGCGALYLYGPHRAEIRSINVERGHQEQGGGELLVQSPMSEARKHQVSCICLFTRRPQFFAKLGFAVAEREDVPNKINRDCCVCPRFLLRRGGHGEARAAQICHFARAGELAEA